MRDESRGLLAAFAAYAIWGLFPVYFRLLGTIGALELLGVRLILTALTCLCILPLRGSWTAFRAVWRDPHSLRSSLWTALLLAGNWFAFIWAVNAGRILESSMGYFLSPLMSVLLAFFAEKEALGWRRWAAIGLAAAGVLCLLLQAGSIPMAALLIALTWSSYGWLKKRSKLGPLVGLCVEAMLLSVPSALLLAVLDQQSSLALPSAGAGTIFTVSFVGLLTATPLILFAYAATRIRLSTLGMGQYLVPCAHFALAVAYGETVTLPVLAGFGLIWLGLAAYSMARG